MQKVVVVVIVIAHKFIVLTIELVLLYECIQELYLKVNVLLFQLLFVATINSLTFGY